ncbi:UDP-4-amino-4,6-dideoxy-N-acetyl-beta-L-altrosamine transaminase [Pelagibacteraceae bacterium]|nr:UDP-4-amino-4,6-dideoxy-N-acetyl-beta-L-altrosamine transaminase [Pelagibacteraceae bacterium]
MKKKTNRFLPYSRQTIDNKDISSVIKYLKNDFITQGSNIKDFEKNFAKFVGSKYAVACSSGTAALHLACLALGLNKNSNLLSPTVSFLASANCAQFLGANTYFTDVENENFTISIDSLKKELKKRKIDVVIAMHMGGQPADLEEIFNLQKKFNFKIIEDACHALGSKYKNTRIGSCKFSDISTFSFHANKVITTGEGGMITTNDKNIFEKILKLRTHGAHKNKREFENSNLALDEKGNSNMWYYEMKEVGYNYRLTSFQSALGNSQLKKINFFLKRKKKIAKLYRSLLKNNNLIKLLPENKNSITANHLFTLLIDFNRLGKSRNFIMNKLKLKGIGSQVLYIPLHLQPYYQKKYGYRLGDFPEAEKYYSDCLSIPIFSDLKDQEVKYIAKNINEIIS